MISYQYANVDHGMDRVTDVSEMYGFYIKIYLQTAQTSSYSQNGYIE